MPLTLNADGEIYATAVADIRGTNRSEVINKTSVWREQSEAARDKRKCMSGGKGGGGEDGTRGKFEI